MKQVLANLPFKKLAIGAAVAIATLVYWPIHTVPTGSRGVITVGGAIGDIKNEGFTLVLPWQKLNNFNIRAEAAQVNNAEGATSDTQPVHVTLTVRYSIQPEKVAQVFEQYSKDGNLDAYVDTATREAFKAVTSKYSAPDLIAKRALVSQEILGGIRTKVAMFGASVISVDVTSFVFSAEYMAAINAKVQQDQLLQAAEKKALTVVAEQKQKVAVAEAEATALRATADGEAYAALTKAKAQAESLRVQNAALAQNKDVLELRRIEVDMEKAVRWDGKLPVNMYGSAPLPYLNLK